MIKTKIKKAIALAWITAIAATSALGGALNTYAATQIGTGSVTGTSAFDTAILWDGTYTANSASGSVSNIIVTATVLPTLNMTISTGSIDLGTLVPNVESTWTVGIEIWTNATNGVSITARSWSGGLTNTASGAIQINDLDADGESYKFSSLTGAIDSSITWFSSQSYAAVEVNDNATENSVYTSNKPEKDDAANYDLVFTVGATATSETPAWDYQDNITFTVTGNF